MFDILFGWKKASKCKKLIRNVQCRLKLLKNKRGSIIRQLREDIAQLLKNGQHQSAFTRVEQLYKDQNILAVYDLLDHFCEFIIIHMPYIRKHRDCPNDINEAVSSLVFSAPRCGDLPELQMLRRLFGEHYGQKFATTAVELLPGNLVNHQISEKFCMKSIPDDVKYKLIDEIARDYCLQLNPEGIVNMFDLPNQQVYDHSMGNSCNQREGHSFDRDIQFNCNSLKEAQMQASNDKKIQVNSTSVVDIAMKEPALDIIEAHNSTAVHKTAAKVENHRKLDPLPGPEMTPNRFSSQTSSGRLSMAYKQHKVDTFTTRNASENSYQTRERSIFCLDDVEEFQPTTQDGKCKDQRLFIFKSISPPDPGQENCGASDGFTEEHKGICESGDDRASSRNSSKRRNSTRKKLKRRSANHETEMYDLSIPVTLSMKDIECEVYYGDDYDLLPNGDLCRPRHMRKHQHKMPTEKRRNSTSKIQEKFLSHQPNNAHGKPYELFFEGGKYLSQRYICDQRRSYSGCCVNDDMVIPCSLEHPCYFLTSDDKDEWESPSWKQKRGIKRLEGFPIGNFRQKEWQEDSYHHFCLPFPDEEAVDSNATMNHNTFRQATVNKTKSNIKEVHEMDCASERDHQNRHFMHDFAASRNHSPSGKTEGTKVVSDYQGSLTTSQDCSPTNLWRKTVRQPPYFRTMTMPPERPKPMSTDYILRSSSCQFQLANPSSSSSSSSSSSHVHPKLPDYDDLAAKFTALKKEYMQTKQAKLATA
ncbi:PREDICTED: uncharacterized protein LOC104586459 [Nelumbo nucifera]|uniref:Uncharacterized protein LOC104586459 n=2 Tax=Nelumbo nucifera TaxID=4432 RepID=A0A1U7YSI8_NELNU|nr:PREDICTED: uncharacterized protein LOC104586459 [Nelumbo nucifera]DAD20875.1 TPA_asm: hypothetical protein HUJ06_022338 [Nelumbo nucifera]